MVGDYEPAAVQFLVHVGYDPVGLPDGAVFQFYFSRLLTYFPRKIAIHVNMSSGQRDVSRRMLCSPLPSTFCWHPNQP